MDNPDRLIPPIPRPLTSSEISALDLFAVQHGRNWKLELEHRWSVGGARPILHALRDSHGLVWLAAFSLDLAGPTRARREVVDDVSRIADRLAEPLADRTAHLELRAVLDLVDAGDALAQIVTMFTDAFATNPVAIKDAVAAWHASVDAARRTPVSVLIDRVVRR